MGWLDDEIGFYIGVIAGFFATMLIVNFVLGVL